MATINSVGNTLSGQTGTGNFVGSNSPTLVTPTLGVASATSINFGGSTLSTYQTATAFTPVFTCATPGDLSVAYTSQVGFYENIGNIIMYLINIIITPTFLTASGQIIVNGLPSNPNTTYGPYVGVGSLPSIIFPAGTTQFYTSTSGLTNGLGFISMGSGVATSNLTISGMVTGTSYAIGLNGWYFI